MKKKIKPSYVPVVKSLGDVSNFDEYPDSGVNAQDIKPSLDPFLTWWLEDGTLHTFIFNHFAFKYFFVWWYQKVNNFLQALQANKISQSQLQ